MPSYFFHLHCPEKDVTDTTGADLRDPDLAWEAARETARDLMKYRGARQRDLAHLPLRGHR